MEKQTKLEQELEELFDIRHAKSRDTRILNEEALLAQRDIRLLTHMFSDGIPEISIPIGDSETVKWDPKIKRLLLIDQTSSQLLETSTKQVMIRVRPHLTLLVKAAKEFF